MELKELAHNLPLPVVQVLRRAHNWKSSEQFHLNSYFLFEVVLKLAAAANVGTYFRERHRSAAVDEELQNLLLPSTGHWTRILRETARYYRRQQGPGLERVSAAAEWFLEPRSDLPACHEWACMAQEAIKTEDAIAKEFSVLRLFEIFVMYRNSVIGHGAARPSAYYARMAEPMLRAIEEILIAGQRHLFHGLTLAHTSLGADGLVWTDLSWISNRLAFNVSVPEMPSAGELYLVGPHEMIPLHPLVVYQEDDSEREHVGFLNKVVYRDDVSRDPVRRLVYLDYATGEPLEQLDAHGSVARMIAELRRNARIAAPNRPPISSPSFEMEEDEILPDEPSARIGDFDILGELGQGSVGVVYRARQRTTSRLVALKVLRNVNQMTLVRFQREIHVLGKVDHRNVVKVLTAGVDGKRHYMAMELVEGSDLAAAYHVLSSWGASTSRELRGGHLAAAITSTTDREKPSERGDLPQAEPTPQTPLPLVEGGEDYFVVLANLLADAADGLEVLHRSGVVHRDVKPGNIMVTADAQRAVIMDLGLAAEVDAMTLAATMTRSRLLGTLRYMAPEQMVGSAVDHRADIYGLGATLYELCCFQPMYPAKNETELIQRRANEEVAPVRKVNPKVPEGLSRIIEKATARLPKDRFASAAEMSDQLRRFVRGEKLKVPGPSLTSRVEHYTRRNRTRFAVGITAAVFAAVAGWFGFETWTMRQQNNLLLREHDLAREMQFFKRVHGDQGQASNYSFNPGEFSDEIRAKYSTLAQWGSGDTESQANWLRDRNEEKVPFGMAFLKRLIFQFWHAQAISANTPLDSASLVKRGEAMIQLANAEATSLVLANDIYALSQLTTYCSRLSAILRMSGAQRLSKQAMQTSITEAGAEIALAKKLMDTAKTEEIDFRRNSLATAYSSLCWYQLLSGLGPEAQKSCQESLQLKPDSSVTTANLAHSLLFQGRGEQAVPLYMKCVGSADDRGVAGLNGSYSDFASGLLGDFDDFRRMGVYRSAYQPIEKMLQAEVANYRKREAEINAAREAAMAQQQQRLDSMKKALDWEHTTGVAREWWEAFEKQNTEHPETITQLCEQLLKRKATITEFFLAYVYSDVDSVEGNLKYLDKMRVDKKNEEENAKK